MERNEQPGGYHRRKVESDAEETAERTIRFVASDETVDRYGDVIVADGWDLRHFGKNGPFLWGHDHLQPIGEIKSVEVVGKRLLATARFASEGVSTLADSLWRLVKDKVVKAFSVGFTTGNVRGKDYEPIFDDNETVTGYRYLAPELLEISLVTVPANPNALALSRSANIPESLIRQIMPLDASVRERQEATRIEIQRVRLRGIQISAPR
jgi:HK97 family phage prohead protease